MTGPGASSGSASTAKQERGQRRREALLDAAVDLLHNSGLRALSHRTVAERAGLPLGATTYYFQSRAELAEEAFGRIVDRELAWTQRHIPDFSGRPPSPRVLAESVVTAVYPRDEAGEMDKAKLASLYELCAQAGREPSLRHLLARWTSGLVAITTDALRHAGYPHEERDARLLVGLVDGLLLEVFEQEDHDAAISRATDTLTHALTLLDPAR